jgi:hypothetical protein
MQVQSKPSTSVGVQDKQPPVALFKSSLRAWQARYKAGHTTPTAERAAHSSGPKLA